jgi:hypothetical protein
MRALALNPGWVWLKLRSQPSDSGLMGALQLAAFAGKTSPGEMIIVIACTVALYIAYLVIVRCTRERASNPDRSKRSSALKQSRDNGWPSD